MRDFQVLQEVLHGRKAMVLAAVFLTCLALVAVFTVLESAGARTLESFSETTAAGDTNYFRLAPDNSASEAVFQWAGRSLVLRSNEKVKIDDTDMVRMGRDDLGRYSIYSVRSRKPEGLFIKMDVGEFLPMRDR
jgi:hypothetical protein